MVLREQGIDPSQVAAVVTDDENMLGTGVLGKLVWYTIGDDLRVTPDELAELFEHFELAKKYLPKEIKPQVVLLGLLRPKRLSASIGGKNFELTFKAEEKVDHSIEAPLTRERRRTPAERRALAARMPGSSEDDWERIPEWDKTTVATLVWEPRYPDKVGQGIKPEFAAEYPYGQLFTEIIQEFDDRRRFYGRDAISGLVAKILDDCRAVSTTRRGAIWFVLPEYMDLLERVETLVRLLESDYRRDVEAGDRRLEAEFDSVILVDNAKNHLMVRTKVEKRIVSELTDAVEQLLTLARAGVVPKPAELAAAAELRKKALSVRDEYAGVIGPDEDYLARIDERLDDFDRAYAAAMSAGRTNFGTGQRR